jgi:hypothetical protein
MPGSRAARRSPVRSNVVFTGLVVVLAATGFRLWSMRGTWFFYDDLFFVQDALREPLSASYLTEPYNGHLMPAGKLLIWLNAHADPWGYALPAIEMTVLTLLVGLGFLRLLVALFGARWGILAPLVLTLFSPIMIPATLWWAAAVNQLPMLVATFFGAAAFVDHLRSGRRRPLVTSTLWLVVGLLFVERTLLALPLLWLIALLYFAAGPFPDRCLRLWRERRALVVSHAVLVGGYLAAYVPFGANFDATSITSRPLFDVLENLVGTAYASGFWGGPLTWRVSDVTQSEAHPSQVALMVGWALLVGLVVASARTRVRALRAWLLPLFVLAANAALIAISRAIYFGPEIALDYRFQTEAAFTTALALALAFLPVTDAVESSAPRPHVAPHLTPRGIPLACIGFLVLTTLSTARYPLRNPGTTSPRTYLQGVAASAAAAPGTQLLDLTVPSWVWAPLAYPTNSYSYMFEPVADDLDIRDVTTDDASLVAADGRFVPIELAPVRRQLDTPDPATGCTGRITTARRLYRLDGPVVGFGWVLEIGYRTPAGATLHVEVADLTYDVELEPGTHDLLMSAPGDLYDDVVLSLHQDAVADEVCLLGLTVGSINDAANAPAVVEEQPAAPSGS